MLNADLVFSFRNVHLLSVAKAWEFVSVPCIIYILSRLFNYICIHPRLSQLAFDDTPALFIYSGFFCCCCCTNTTCAEKETGWKAYLARRYHLMISINTQPDMNVLSVCLNNYCTVLQSLNQHLPKTWWRLRLP